MGHFTRMPHRDLRFELPSLDINSSCANDTRKICALNPIRVNQHQVADAKTREVFGDQ